MKSLLLLTAAVSLAAGTIGCSSASTKHIALHHANNLSWPLDEATDGNHLGDRTYRLEPGNHRDAVLAQLGLPQAAIGRDIWVFGNAESPDTDTRRLGYNTLVVAFANDRITHLRLVNGNQAKEILARHMTGARPGAQRLAAGH